MEDGKMWQSIAAAPPLVSCLSWYHTTHIQPVLNHNGETPATLPRLSGEETQNPEKRIVLYILNIVLRPACNKFYLNNAGDNQAGLRTKKTANKKFYG